MSTDCLTNYINGAFASAKGERWLDVVEPATGQVYAQVARSDAGDVDAAVEAGQRAFGAWAGMGAAGRGELLCSVADLIEENLDALAQAESKDTGKPVSLARSVDIPRAAANLRYFAHAAQHTQDKAFVMQGQGSGGGVKSQSVAGGAVNYVVRSPRGVAGCISPWNLPLYLLTWKIAPALATGNTVVAKPSEVTPMTAYLLCELFDKAGVPAGVLNMVHGLGDEAGGPIVTHTDVPTLTFTGSTTVGSWIGEQAGRMLKRVSLELGGKNPFVVFDDVDVDAVADQAVRAAFANQGQICLCGSRFLVHQPIYDRFVNALVSRAQVITVGDPNDQATTMGALISEQHLAKVDSYVTKARDLGGTIHCGGSRVDPASLPSRCAHGSFYQPTVITGLANDCPVIQEEIFGPVITIQPFADEHEAVTLANSTPYGLASTVWTNDLTRAHRVADCIDSGIVWVNCWLVRDLRTPFGGSKASGVGREGGQDALHFFTEPKNICVKI